MPIEIVEQSTDLLHYYGVIPVSFTVNSQYRVDAIDQGLGGWRLTEERVESPYVKDYDNKEDGQPTRWSKRWDTSNWVILAAFNQEVRIGGAVVAWNTPGVDMLEGRDDLAVLWDIRIHPDHCREGIGSHLFHRATQWARAKECRHLKIETQNINVRACKFYANQGCYLGAAHLGIYEGLPDEVQLLWYLNL